MYGSRIRKYRKSKGLKTKEFARLIGISQGALSGLETGKSKPSADTLASIVQHTDINPIWLLTGKGKRYLSEEAKAPPIYKEASINKTVEEGMEQPLNLELDVDLLADIIESVDIVLEKEKIELPLNKKARFIALQYELCIETGKGITSDKIKRHLKLVA